MKIRIKETGKMKELTIIDENGIEWTQDLITASDFWDENAEEFEMSADEFEWWAEYIADYKEDEKAIADLAEKTGINKLEIWEKINKETGLYDMENHSEVRREALEELEKEY